MLSLGCERLPTPSKKKKKKVLDHYLHNDLGMLPLLRCFFAHLLILQYPDHHQNLISSSLYYLGPVHKISSQSVHNFLSNVVHRQTNKQTRSTQRAQTSLAEADHYSHIAHCKNVEPWVVKDYPPPSKKKKKGSGSLPSPRSGYATTITVFFCSFTHLTIPRSPQKFNQFFPCTTQDPSIKFHPNPFITF